MASGSKIKIILGAVLCFALYCAPVQAETKVKYKADNVSYGKDSKSARLLGNVEVIIEEVIITGEEMDVDLDQRIVYTNKPFRILTKREGKDTEIIGKSFNFNIDTKRLVAKFASLETDAQAPGQKVYITGEEITVFNKGERVSIVNGDFTTCEYTEEGRVPHYSMKATSMDFIPDDRVIAWNTAVYMGGNKTFWFPFWYIPLKSSGPDFNLDIGKNEAEGMFINFKNYYNLNPYHDGNIFFRVMEKKWLGLGFEHTWMANPTSVSYLYAYANPFNARHFLEPNAAFKQNISQFFEDREIYLRHEQWLPFLPNAQFNLTLHDRSFYNINSVLSPRDDFDEYKFDFFDREIYQPFRDLNITFNPNLTASYRQQRDSNLNNELRIIQTSANNVLSLNGRSELRFNDVTLNLNSTFNNTIRESLFQDPNQQAATSSGVNTGANRSLNYFKSSDNIDFNNDLSLNYPILPNLTFKGNLKYNNNDPRTFSQPTAATLPSVQTSSESVINQRLNSNFSLEQSLGWGNLALNVDHYTDFQEADIFPRDAGGNIIPDNQLNAVQAAKRQEALRKRRSGGYINKLPELNLTLDPFFNDFLPVTLSANVGRYLEASNFSTTNLSNRLLDIVRSETNLLVGSKSLDLGLGNKVNLAGTGYQQRFYQTQDAQYSLTGQLNYTNDLVPFFTPNVSYTKVIQDNQNNTPFVFDRLSKDRQDRIISSFNIGNIPAFTLQFSNIGYDFGDPYSKDNDTQIYKGYDRGFLSPVNIGLTSDFTAGAHFILSAQSGYVLNTIRSTDVNKVNPNFTDKNKLKTDIENAALSQEDFSRNYVGFSKTEAQRDLNSLNDEALRKKYGIDNRLYDALKRDVVDNSTRLGSEDIGRLELRGGKIAPLTLSFGVGTPWEFGLDSFFGKEQDIPWGLAGQINTNIDFHRDDFYKTKADGGTLTSLSSYQSYVNSMQKIQNFSLGALFVLGGSWLTHTHFEINLTLIQPEQVPIGRAPTQTNQGWLPFNTVFSIKKDLHDFILSFDFQNQYVPTYNKRDFMFSLNLEMTAFPFSTRDITGATKNLSNLTNQVDSALNQ